MSSPQTTRFGKYELLDRIAAGGMAEIFRARYEPAPGVTKQVVIKRILPHYAENKAFIAMFTNEAKIVMGLSHGNIAQVFDFGAIDGDYFLAMELVDGHPLSKVVKRARTMGIPVLPPEFAAFITAEMLKGLHYAHARLDEEGRPLTIVHRDISPQNVLVSYEAQIKLVDFGIAKARNASEETNTGGVKGKFAYFSPEQARGKELDARTDVFASGIVLYEMLTGQLPFQGRMMDVLSKLVRGTFPRPRELNRDIPVELERIVLKAMALDRDERYESAEAFHQALTRYLAQAHPDFVPGELTWLLQLLFEEELVGAGRPVQLPREFLDRAAQWKKAPRRNDDDEEDPTEMMQVADDAPKRRSVDDRRVFLMRAGVLVTAALVVGFLTVLVTQQFRRGGLSISSLPAGAKVLVDGRALSGVTPLTLTELEAGERHHLVLQRDGFEPWAQDVTITRGQPVQVKAQLVALPPPVVEVVDAGTPLVELPTVAPPPPSEVTWPNARSFALVLERHHVDLGAAGATIIKLDPTMTYRVALSRGPNPGWGFYVVNDAGATPVAWAGQPLQVKGASKLLAFRLPLALMGLHTREEAPRTLSMQVAGARKPVTHAVPAALAVPEGSWVHLKGLSASATYEVTPSLGDPAPRISPQAPVISRVVVATKTGFAVQPVGSPFRLSGVSEAAFLVVSDGTQPSGRVEFTVAAAKR